MPAIEEVLRSMDDDSSPEAAATARAWLAARTVPATDRTAVVRNPARGEPLATVPLASAAEVEAAVAAADTASPAWAALPGGTRARHLRGLASLVRSRGTLLAELQTLETGRPIRASRCIDLPIAIRSLEHHAGAARLEAGDPGRLEPYRSMLPAAKPLAGLAQGLASALASGRTAVLVAPATAPLAALAFADLCRDAGLPPGVVSVVCVASEERAAEPGTLFIVLADADLDAAVEGVAEAVWSNGTVGSCLLVQEGVAERFGRKLGRRLDTIRTGDPLDPSTDRGAVSTPERLAGLRDLLDRAEREGATLVRAAAPLPHMGWFAAPVLATGVEPASALFGRPVPGPVAAVTTFRTAGEALALAENSGLTRAVAVWSSGIEAALDLVTSVRADTVWINAVDLVDPAASPAIVESARPPSAEPSTKARDAVARGVAAAGKAASWGRMAPDRAAALQGLADALLARTGNGAARLAAATGVSLADATRDLEAVAERIALTAAQAERGGGRVAAARARHLVLMLDEPFGLVGLVCRPDLPLLGLVALLMPALAAGNCVLLAPPRPHGLAPADLAGLLGLGALPGGTVTLLDGEPGALAAALADHPEVAAVWSSNDTRQGADEIRSASRVKVLWVPYGA